jgi:carbon monoxide dehydrogenase subunit G
MIEISEEFAVVSSRERVWEVLSDPYAVVTCVPGAAIVSRNEDGSFDATLSIKFGPTTIAFAARVTLELDVARWRGRIEATGREGVGGTRIRVASTFDIAPIDGSSVRVTIRGTADVVGRLAGLISGGANLMIKRMSGEFAERLAARCTLSGAQAPAGA